MLTKFLSPFQKKPERKSLPKLRLHNSLSDEKEEFVPLGRTVKLYNCGPTAYDEQHIGNLFPPVVANVLARTLRAASAQASAMLDAVAHARD